MADERPMTDEELRRWEDEQARPHRAGKTTAVPTARMPDAPKEATPDADLARHLDTPTARYPDEAPPERGPRPAPAHLRPESDEAMAWGEYKRSKPGERWKETDTGSSFVHGLGKALIRFGGGTPPKEETAPDPYDWRQDSRFAPARQATPASPAAPPRSALQELAARHPGPVMHGDALTPRLGDDMYRKFSGLQARLRRM